MVKSNASYCFSGSIQEDYLSKEPLEVGRADPLAWEEEVNVSVFSGSEVGLFDSLVRTLSDSLVRTLSCSPSEIRSRLYFEQRSSFNEDIKTINSSMNNTIENKNHIITFLCWYLLINGNPFSKFIIDSLQHGIDSLSRSFPCPSVHTRQFN